MQNNNKQLNNLMFETFITNTLAQQETVKNTVLSEDEIKNLLNIVDLTIILKYQRMSIQFIKDNILPLLEQENKIDPSRPITLEHIVLWQKLDSISLLLD